MSPLNLLLWGVGIGLIAVGYVRAREPWRRYQALKQQDANIARYEAWRGRARDPDDSKTGASVAMEMFQRQARIGAGIAIVGFVLVFLGFFLG